MHEENVGERHRKSAVQADMVNQMLEKPTHSCCEQWRYCVKLPYHCLSSNQGVRPQRVKLVTCYAKHVDSFGECHVNWCPRTCNTVSRQGKILEVEFMSQSQLTTSDILNLTCAETDKL